MKNWRWKTRRSWKIKIWKTLWRILVQKREFLDPVEMKIKTREKKRKAGELIVKARY